MFIIIFSFDFSINEEYIESFCLYFEVEIGILNIRRVIFNISISMAIQNCDNISNGNIKGLWYFL
jgi:hypothetical protein